MKFDSMDIIKAMLIIADSNNSKLRLDKTITAVIESVENLETGEYRVKYEGNSFLAYSYDVTISFEVGNNVYVKIPENDMSKRKIIEGKVSSSGNTLTDIIEQLVEINEIEPSLDMFYNYNAGATYGLVAGVGLSHLRFMQTIFQSTGDTLADNFFRSYARNYNKIKISGSFFTSFAGQHNKGNYGLIATFRTRQYDDAGHEIMGSISYRLDFSNFVGDPYRYTSPSPQSVVIDILEQSVVGLDSIIFFQEGFETDKSVNYLGEIIRENNGTDTPPICNIFVKDIKLSFCEIIDLKETSYYLTIAAPHGVIFTNTSDSLTLDARLKHKGKNILSSNTCKVYWYKENLEIRKGDERYDKLAGVRWENINPVGNEFTPTIYVPYNDVKSHALYKVVVVYQDVILSKEIELRRFNPTHDLRIRQVTENNSRIVLQVVSNIENDGRPYTADWYFLLPDGGYDSIPDSQRLPSVDVTDYLIYPTATFFCQTYYNNEPISIEHHFFQISDSDEDLTITYLGQDVFQYDANGDIAYEDTELDRTLGIEILWKEGLGSAYLLSYLASDGTLLTSDRTKAYTPPNSMMQNLWVDSTNVLHYNIGLKYNINYNNNVVTVKIKCVGNGNEYLFQKEILFLKDGDLGTNGTTYICAIRPVDLKNGLKLNEYKALEYNGGWQGNGIDLRCYVYKNGDMINNSPNFELTFDWECGSLTSDRADKLRLSAVPGFTDQPDYQRIQGIGTLDTRGDYVIKMTLRVRERSNNENTQIYCLYPIDVAVGGFNMSYVDMNLPSYIKYTASGINASFLNQDLRCTYRGSNLPITSTDTSTLKVTNNKLDPIQKFQYTGGIAALKCTYSTSVYLLHPVMMYLDTYGNEAINGWDGTRLKLDEDGKYILAPQIGAGKKESDNTFTGVVMGHDTAQDKIGLYGYRRGIAQFGFKEDGTAFIGPSGKGQILFDGNKGTITSGNYIASNQVDAELNKIGQGMKIDLENGHIDAYNFKVSSGNMLLSSADSKFEFIVDRGNNSSRFLIAHEDGTKLFYIGRDQYYLQSLDYVINTSGIKIDLNKGKIDAFNFILQAGNMSFDSAKQRFEFKVGSVSGSRFLISHDNGTVLFKAGENEYYLQSKDYSVLNETGVRIDLNSGRITGYTFRLKTPTMDLDSDNAKFEFTVHSTKSSSAFRINARSTDVTNSNKTLFNASANSYYLQSGNYEYNASTGDITGTYINLQNGTFRAGGNAEFSGKITAKSGTIGGWSITETMLRSSDGKVYLSSTGGFKAGDNFMVTAAGNLTCESANIKGSLSADSLFIRQLSGNYLSALSLNQRGNTGIDGKFVTCEGLLVGSQNSDNYFAVLNGVVYLNGTMRMGPGSTIAWSSPTITDGAPFAYPKDLDDLEAALNIDIGAAKELANNAISNADALASAVGATRITGSYIWAPVISAAWITSGLIQASLIDVGSIMNIGGGSISVTGAQSAPSAIQITGQSVRIEPSLGNVFLGRSGGTFVNIEGGIVSIQPDIVCSGVRFSDLVNRVQALENAGS